MLHEHAWLHAKSIPAVLVAHSFDRPTSWPVSQIFTRLPRRPAISIALAALLAIPACRSAATPETTAAVAQNVARGGEIVASVRSEPGSFNRHTGRDTTTYLVALLTQARLVRVNQSTQQVESALAESWTTSADGRVVTMALRKGVVFSDG